MQLTNFGTKFLFKLGMMWHPRKSTVILAYHFTCMRLLIKFRDEISFKLGMM
ncbi:hypothetical protein HanHA300_Chr01g0009251 [Helianthus annuus]|nr:hypothetical protein HanHA300_Chr01g0009251 [Helianthus annuus]KAJ0626173.1 hypothetical protein HanHA89_Chr01g0010051 [Helianthus annuus]KAJ0782506.1 hypothetical protein HanLR1_Chr01g0009001 [Helianthus annuus]